MNDATLLCTIYIYGEHKPKIFEHFAAKRSKSFARTRSKTPAVGGDDAREAAAAAALGQSKRPPPPLGSGGHLMQMAQRKRQHVESAVRHLEYDVQVPRGTWSSYFKCHAALGHHISSATALDE